MVALRSSNNQSRRKKPLLLRGTTSGGTSMRQLHRKSSERRPSKTRILCQLTSTSKWIAWLPVRTSHSWLQGIDSSMAVLKSQQKNTSIVSLTALFDQKTKSNVHQSITQYISVLYLTPLSTKQAKAPTKNHNATINS